MLKAQHFIFHSSASTIVEDRDEIQLHCLTHTKLQRSI